jgi:hypothetical protein
MKKIALLLALTALPSLANANLLTNGSFEDTIQANGSWAVYTSFTGWTTASGPGIELRNNIAGAASDGVNYVELDSYGNSSMFQNVATTAGINYDLSFDYSPRIGQAAKTNGIQAYWNNELLTTVTGKGGSANNWYTLSFDVVGTGNDKLTFKAVGLSDSYGSSLDNVALTATNAYSMLLAGLGLLGVSARRRLS